jgi:hypothetical protein
MYDYFNSLMKFDWKHVVHSMTLKYTMLHVDIFNIVMKTYLSNYQFQNDAPSF